MSLQLALIVTGALLFVAIVVVSVLSQRPGMVRFMRRRVLGRAASAARRRVPGLEGDSRPASSEPVSERLRALIRETGSRASAAAPLVRPAPNRRSRDQRREPVIGSQAEANPPADSIEPDDERLDDSAPKAIAHSSVSSTAPGDARSEQPTRHPVREPRAAGVDQDAAHGGETVSGDMPTDVDDTLPDAASEASDRFESAASPARRPPPRPGRRRGLFEQLGRRRRHDASGDEAVIGDESPRRDARDPDDSWQLKAPSRLDRLREGFRGMMSRLTGLRSAKTPRARARANASARATKTSPSPAVPPAALADSADTSTARFADADEPVLEFVARLPGHAPVARDVPLAVYRLEEYMIDRPLRLLGLAHPEAIWIDLERAAEDQGVTDVAVSVQLADRNGPITETELTRFQQLVMKLADSLGGGFRFSMTVEEALRRGEELDRVCREFDALAVVNIVAVEGREFSGRDIDAGARACAMEMGRMSIYNRPGPGQRHLFSLANLFKPGTFDKDDLDSVRTRGLTLFMNIPWSRDPLTTFEAMLETAGELCDALGGQLVDENRAPLTGEGVEAIREQIRGIAEGMRESGVAPGSAAALRLF